MKTFRQRLGPGRGYVDIEADDLKLLADKVSAFRQNRKITPSSYSAVMRQIKAALPRSERIRNDREERKRQREAAKSGITLGGALKAAKAAFKLAVGQTVSQVEVKRRAAICRSCPQLKRIDGCFSG